MPEHKNRCVVRRILAPPSFPRIAGPLVPWTPNRSEHITSQDPGADICEGLLGHIIVNAFRPFALTVHLLKCLCCEKPPVQFQPANPKDRKSTRLNSSHQIISYAVFCLKKKKKAK